MLFFGLANNCIYVETTQMLNTIFPGLNFFENYIKCDKSKLFWQKDGIYEMKRQYFGSEVFFREKEIFSPLNPIENFKGGIYRSIYDQITNIKDFADISIKDMIYTIIFKRMDYMSMSTELDLLKLEDKDPKIVRFYRSLEAGASIFKMLDRDETARDACIILFHYKDYIII